MSKANIMSQIFINILIFFIPIGATFAHFKVFQNSLDPGNIRDSSAGAILKEHGGTENNPTILEAFTLCIRFQLKVLGTGGFHQRGMVVNIGDM